MRLQHVFTVCGLSWTVFAAKQPSQSKFDTFFAKQAVSSPIKLDSQSYDDLTLTSRDYSVAILLTALGAKYSCGVCKDFQPEWDILAKSWQKGDKTGESRTLFGTLDIDNGVSIFQRLQLQTAPVLFLFPPTVGPGAKPGGQPLRYDFSNMASAEIIHSWITDHIPAGDYPPFIRPFNFTRLVVAITALMGFITFGTVAFPYVSPIIQNRNIWSLISLVLVLVFTSGQMFNRIRGVQYVPQDRDGRITEFFAPGFSNQYGLETQIVAVMYAVLSFATIALALQVPRIEDPKRQQVAVLIWCAVMLCMYSFLISVFKIKNGGYPFWLPPF